MLIGANMFMTLIWTYGSNNEISKKLIFKVLHAKMKYFTKNSSGKIMSKFGSDLHELDVETPWIFREIFYSITKISINSIYLIFFVSPFYLLVLFSLVLILKEVVIKKYQLTIDKIQKLKTETKSPLYSLFNETIKGLTTIRAMNKQKQTKKKYLKQLKMAINVSQNINWIDRWFFFKLELFQSLFVFLSILILILFLKFIPKNLVSISLIRIIHISKESTKIIMLVSRLTSITIVISKFFQSINIKSENYDFENYEKLLKIEKKKEDVEESWPRSNEIKFRDVRMKYIKSENSDVLKGVSFDCNANEKIGICGRTG